MASSTCIPRLRVDSAQMEVDLSLLSRAAERFPLVRLRMLDAGDLAAHVRCVCLDKSFAAAVDGGEVWVRLELSNSLAELVAAVRAGGFDGLCV
jgi:hypothetical protein